MAAGLYDITPLEHLISQGYTLLTPNFRLARRIKAQWDAQCRAAGQRTWEPVLVQPLEAWLQQRWEIAASQNLMPPLTPLSPAQALEVWRQVIGNRQRVSADFHLLQPASAAELASQARDTLVRWRVDMRNVRIRSQFELDADCLTFLHWLDAFEKSLADNGQCTLTDCLEHLTAQGSRAPVARVALVECGLLTPVQQAALDSQCAEIVQVSPASQEGQRLVHPYTDKRAELQAVATWAAEAHRTNPQGTIGIVLGDMTGDRVPLEYLLRREFDCLGDDYASLPVNFSAGIPLLQAPVVRDALAVLAMALQHTTPAAVHTLLRSRFLALADAHSPLALHFVQQLYAQGRAEIPLEEVRRAANNIALGETRGLALGRCLSALKDKRSTRVRGMPSQWVERFSEILQDWGWPGTQALDSVEYQQLVLWHRTLEEFSTFDNVCEPMPFTQALTLLRDCCQRQISQPQTADSAIQVLGPLEAAGLAFEHLWLCGMQSADWPAAPRPNPFIPVALQTRLQMPHATAEREWLFAEALLQQYGRASGVLHASYCRQLDGVPELPSALLHDFTVMPTTPPALVSASWREQHATRAHESIADRQAPVLAGAPLSAIRGGSQLLEDQSQCPFRAFARHRLQVAPLAAPDASLSAGERGSLMHEALSVLWQGLGDYSALQALDQTQTLEVVTAAVQAAMANAPDRYKRKAGAAFWRLEQKRLSSLLQEWLAVERQRGEFLVAACELGIELELAGLSLRLRVDRVDELPDGSRVIIDYKSGNASARDWRGERPAKPQLLLYSTVEPERVAALTFARLRPRECSFEGLGRIAAAPGIATDLSRISTAGDWETLNSQWRDTLEQLAAAFMAGDAQVDPLTPSSCTWCGLQALCRIDHPLDEQSLSISGDTA